MTTDSLEQAARELLDKMAAMGGGFNGILGEELRALRHALLSRALQQQELEKQLIREANEFGNEFRGCDEKWIAECVVRHTIKAIARGYSDPMEHAAPSSREVGQASEDSVSKFAGAKIATPASPVPSSVVSPPERERIGLILLLRAANMASVEHLLDMPDLRYEVVADYLLSHGVRLVVGPEREI